MSDAEKQHAPVPVGGWRWLIRCPKARCAKAAEVVVIVGLRYTILTRTPNSYVIFHRSRYARKHICHSPFDTLKTVEDILLAQRLVSLFRYHEDNFFCAIE